MAVKLSPKEFYHTLSKRTGIKDEDVQLLWETFAGFAVEELLRNGKCYLPYIGNFEMKQRGGRNGHIPDKNGGVKNIYIEPYLVCKFYATEIFQQNLNNGRVPRIELKRERERYRTEQETEKQEQAIKDLLAKQEERIAKARQQRIDRIHKQRSYNRMTKKQQEEFDRQQADDYDEFEI